MGTAEYQSDLTTRPTMNTETKPTTVVPPITPATAGEPIARANMEAPRAVRPITKPNNWPLFISASAARNAANSISCWCFASDSAMTKMRSAAPLTRRSYPSSTAGGGIGPEKVAYWNWATGLLLPLPSATATVPLAVVTAFLGCFCFCAGGLAIVGERTAGAGYRLANAGEMTSHTLRTSTAGCHLTQVARGSQVHDAPCAAKKVFSSGIHSRLIVTGMGLTIKMLT